MFGKLIAGLLVALGLAAGTVAWASSTAEPICCKKLAACCPNGPCCGQ